MAKIHMCQYMYYSSKHLYTFILVTYRFPHLDIVDVTFFPWSVYSFVVVEILCVFIF